MTLLLAEPFPFEIINTVAAAGSFFVITATAVAALIQIRHLRASNELEALLTLTQQLRGRELQEALRFVQLELAGKLDDPAYRRELYERGFIDAARHPEMEVCNWFNGVGALVKNKLIDERIVLDLFSRLVTFYWNRLAPAIALLRRQRGAGEYENFEFLASLAKRWDAKHPAGTYPPKYDRLAIADRWEAADRTTPA